MKKLISMMLMLCAIITFSACSSDDDGPSNPVSNAVVPSSAKIGSEVTVQGSGFAAGQTLWLQAESSDAVNVNAKISSNGATFTIPYTFSTGKVNVILKSGNDSWTLGSMTLLDADNPISAMSLPTEMAIGKEVTIAGLGFAEGDQIALVNGTRSQMTMEVEKLPGTVTADGLKFTVSPNKLEGDYLVVLFRGNSRWDLGFTTVYQPRQIASITISNNALMAMYASMIGLTDDALVLNLAYNENGMLSAVTSNAGLAWELSYDGKTVTCVADPFTNTFTLDEQNRIVKSTAIDPYTEETITHIWSYDANGYLVSVKKEGVEADDNNLLATYTDGNLSGYTMTFDNQLTTANKDLHVCPGTVEPAYLVNTFSWAMRSALSGEELFIGFLLNQNVKVSAYVPTEFIAGDIDGMTGENIQTPSAITSSFKDNVLTLQAAGAALAPSVMMYANTVSVKYKNK